MIKLRPYELNGGDMLELTRYQKRELYKVSRAKYDILSSTEIMKSEKKA